MTSGESENVRLVRESFERLEREGYEATLPTIHPEFELKAAPEMVSERVDYRGPEGFRRYWESWYDAMEEVRFEAERYIDRGAAVVVPFRLVARGRASGIETEQRGAMVWRIRDGLAVGVDAYPTLEDALASLQEDE